MKKIIDVCTRVEGHGSIKILLQKDEISNVSFEVHAIRGFEKILLNKKLVDVPRIVSRICGLCHASQGITSCKAIESMFEIEPSEQSILLRRLIMIGELIKSHSMHFFFQAFPDLFPILKIQKNPLLLNDLIHFDVQLTSKIYELIKISDDIVGIFGGRSIHTITPIIGGVIYSPSKKDIGLARKYFQKASENIEWIIEKFQELFSHYTPPTKYFLPNSIFMGLHNNENYDHYDGIIRLKLVNAILADFTLDKYSKYFDRVDGLRGIDFFLREETNILVGPIARYKIIEGYGIEKIQSYIEAFNKSWQNNIIFSNFLRLIEILFATNKALSILDDYKLLNRIEITSMGSLKNNEGMGIVEAPRGTLIHHYHVNKKKLINKVKLFIATEINMPIINEILTKESQKLYERTGDLNQIKKQAQMIIRLFDPCISCATH